MFISYHNSQEQEVEAGVQAEVKVEGREEGQVAVGGNQQVGMTLTFKELSALEYLPATHPAQRRQRIPSKAMLIPGGTRGRPCTLI
jgi:hypothetical protein